MGLAGNGGQRGKEMDGDPWRFVTRSGIALLLGHAHGILKKEDRGEGYG